MSLASLPGLPEMGFCVPCPLRFPELPVLWPLSAELPGASGSEPCSSRAVAVAPGVSDLAVFVQYRNASNPLAHYDTTAEEILQQCEGAYPSRPVVHIRGFYPCLPGSV